MKLGLFLLAIAATVARVEAVVACGWNDMGSVVFRAFAQGFQNNRQATSSDCFIEVG